MAKLTFMMGMEFIIKVLANERNFQRIKLEERFDFNSCEGFGEMQKYLKNADLKTNYLRLSDSDFSYCRACCLFLPHVEARNLKLIESDLRGAIFEEANFYGAQMFGAQLELADLRKADLRAVFFKEANLERAKLCNADLREAIFWKANLYRANLAGAKLIGADIRGAIFNKPIGKELEFRP